MITAMDPHMESEAVIIPVITTMMNWAVEIIFCIEIFLLSVYMVYGVGDNPGVDTQGAGVNVEAKAYELRFLHLCTKPLDFSLLSLSTQCSLPIRPLAIPTTYLPHIERSKSTHSQ